MNKFKNIKIVVPILLGVIMSSCTASKNINTEERIKNSNQYKNDEFVNVKEKIQTLVFLKC